MPRGTSSVFTRAFRAKRTLMYISREKGDHSVTSKHGTTIFFYLLTLYNLFLGKLKEKLSRKAHVKTDASTSDGAYASLGIP